MTWVHGDGNGWGVGRATRSCISTLSVYAAVQGLQINLRHHLQIHKNHHQFLTHSCCLCSSKASSADKLVSAFACHLALSVPDSQGKLLTTWFPVEKLISAKQHHVIRRSCLCLDQTMLLVRMRCTDTSRFVGPFLLHMQQLLQMKEPRRVHG